MQEATAGHRAEMDPLSGFLDDRCLFRDGAQVTVQALYEAYVAWCTTNGEEALGKNACGRRLRERGLEQGRGHAGVRYWCGIGLLGEPEQLDLDGTAAEREMFTL